MITRVAVWSILWTAVVAAAKLTVGVMSGSVAVVGDGLHSAIDLFATTITYAAVRTAARPPDADHPWGHGRAENLAALSGALLMGVAAAGVAWEAVRRITSGREVELGVSVVFVMVAAIGIDTVRAITLRRAARRYSSPALHADAMNFTADIAESAAVLAAVVAAGLGLPLADPIAALVVVVLMVSMAARVGTAAVNVLMDRQPLELTEQVEHAVAEVPGVHRVEGVRLRRSGADTLAEVTVEVARTESVERSHDITEAVEAAVDRVASGAETTVHVEPTGTGEDLVARVFAAANRLGIAHQLHNVMGISHPEGLWLTLHAKVDADTPLRDAHRVTDLLEAELRAEIGGLARVEIHLEPLEPHRLPGRVVSATRTDLVDAVTAMAGRRPPISGCHEVAVSEADDGLYLVLHCEAPPDASIGIIHQASLGLEDDIHRAFPQVRAVTVHFEPRVM